MRLVGRLVSAADLSAPLVDAMFRLMDRHYANVRRPVFEADLAEKQWVILVSDPATDRLCGFSTQKLIDVPDAAADPRATGGRPVKALFSGDTIVGREHWGDPALSRAWGRHASSLIDAYPGHELYWFLLSQGFRTYRFLPVFFREFYPHHSTPTPLAARAVLDALARTSYPALYDAEAGVVRAAAWQYHLRSELAEVGSGRGNDPHVRFFHQVNPGHAGGDELCCLAPLTHRNFTPAALRVIGM